MQYLDNAAQHLQSLAWSATLVAIFAIAELRRPGWSSNAITRRLLNFFLGTLVAAFGLVLSYVFLGLQRFIPADGLLGYVVPGWRPTGVFGLLLSIAVYGIAWDFFQYWFHRTQHQMPSLWPSHRVHHSDDAINASTALRRSLPELALIFIFVFLPTVLTAGIEPVAAWFAFVIFYSWGFFNHADLRIPLGVLTPVLSGPAWHRLHHGLDAPYGNCNYAAFFPVLDILFGTYLAPRLGELPATGITESGPSDYPIRDCLAPRSVLSSPNS